MSNDQEMEEQIVIMLKDIGMPPEYINKLSQMFKDIKVSNDINDKFKAMARNLNNSTLAGKQQRITLSIEKNIWILFLFLNLKIA